MQHTKGSRTTSLLQIASKFNRQHVHKYTANSWQGDLKIIQGTAVLNEAEMKRDEDLNQGSKGNISTMRCETISHSKEQTGYLRITQNCRNEQAFTVLEMD